MTHRIITKRQIIKAIEDEVAFKNRGSWSCAAGDVLMAYGISCPNRYLDSVYPDGRESILYGSWDESIDNNRWLQALSRFYEQNGREKTIQFVKDRFPAKLRLARGW